MTWLTSIILGSFWARIMALLLVGFVALKAYGLVKEHQGVNKQIAKQEKVNNAAKTITGGAARKSGDPTARGVLDPNTVR